MPDLGFVKLVAVHEASHGAVAYRLGLPIASIQVHWSADSIGFLDYQPQIYSKFERGELLGSRLMVSAAGKIGESIYLDGKNIDPLDAFDINADSTDARHVREAAAVLAAQTGQDAADIIRRSVLTSYGHLIAAWPALLRLAEHLATNLRVSGALVQTFFRK